MKIPFFNLYIHVTPKKLCRSKRDIIKEVKTILEMYEKEDFWDIRLSAIKFYRIEMERRGDDKSLKFSVALIDKLIKKGKR